MTENRRNAHKRSYFVDSGVILGAKTKSFFNFTFLLASTLLPDVSSILIVDRKSVVHR